MITQPFNFASHLRRPGSPLDWIAAVDLVVIALFFVLFQSKFVLAPGISINLPSARAEQLAAVAASRVLTVQQVEGGELLLFIDDRRLTLQTLEKALADGPRIQPGEVLLVRLDRNVTAGAWMQLIEIGLRAGFADVVLAAQPETTETRLSP